MDQAKDEWMHVWSQAQAEQNSDSELLAELKDRCADTSFLVGSLQVRLEELEALYKAF